MPVTLDRVMADGFEPVAVAIPEERRIIGRVKVALAGRTVTSNSTIRHAPVQPDQYDTLEQPAGATPVQNSSTKSRPSALANSP